MVRHVRPLTGRCLKTLLYPVVKVVVWGLIAHLAYVETRETIKDRWATWRRGPVRPD